jgi:hypothetical protein
MKKISRKTLALLAALLLLMALPVHGTVAFLADRTGAIPNTFTPVEVDTVIVETVAKGEKTSIAVQNPRADNHIDAYVRVVVVGNWVDADGNIVAPWSLDSYNTSSWTKNGQFYYYNQVLTVGQTTDNLLTGSGIKEADLAKPKGADHLVVTVVHQSIQAAGWPDSVDTAQEAFEQAAQSVRQPAQGQ